MKWKKIFLMLSSFFFLFFPFNSKAQGEEGRVVGLDDNVASYIIINQETGEVYHEKNADDIRPMASMSKLMTYLLVKDAIGEGKLSMDTEVTVSKGAEELSGPQYSALGLKEGEKFTVEELLEGLMVVSGNDCAYQLACEVSGSEKEFAKLMNLKAIELDLLTQSYFNASGIQTEDGHQNSTSARDYARLSQYVIEKYPEILDYAKIREINDSKRGIHEKSTIPLVGEIDGVDGLKTGTTEEAGYCLVTTCDLSKLDKNDDFRVIGVELGADSEDTRKSVMSDLIYYVSRFYDKKNILNPKRPVDTIKVNTGKEGYVEAYPTEYISFIMKKGEIPVIRYSLEKNLKAPIKAGTVVGKADISYKEEKYEVDLVTKEDLEEASGFTKFMRSSKDACDFLLKCIISR